MSWDHEKYVQDTMNNGNSTGQYSRMTKRGRSPANGSNNNNNNSSSNNNNNDNNNGNTCSNDYDEFRQPQQTHDGSPWRAMKRLRVEEQFRDERVDRIVIDDPYIPSTTNVSYEWKQNTNSNDQFSSTNNSNNVSSVNMSSNLPINQIQTIQSQGFLNSIENHQQQQMVQQYENVNRVLGNLHQERMRRENVTIASNSFHNNNTNSVDIAAHQNQYRQSTNDNNNNNNLSHTKFESSSHQQLHQQHPSSHPSSLMEFNQSTQHHHLSHHDTNCSMPNMPNNINNRWIQQQQQQQTQMNDASSQHWHNTNRQLDTQQHNPDMHHQSNVHQNGHSRQQGFTYRPNDMSQDHSSQHQQQEGRKKKVVRLFTNSKLG
jgi:hypothetical protein